jgi:hypothetical protein
MKEVKKGKGAGRRGIGFIGTLMLIGRYVRDVAMLVGHSTATPNRVGDRQGFAAVSAGRCHTQKKHYKGYTARRA